MLNHGFPSQVTLDHIWSVYSALELPKLCPQTQGQFPGLFRKFAEEIGGGGRLVASIKRFEIGLWMQSNKERWPSPWTRKSKLLMLGRVFSFAVEMDLTNRNPFWRFKTDPTTVDTRPITAEEFQRLFRAAPQNFRWLLLFLRRTGCRPCEAQALRWTDLDLDRGVAVLKEHKTAKKTGKPRIIPLPKMIVKLLRWMQAHPYDPPVHNSIRLYDLLAAGPLRAFKVRRWQRANRISDRALHQARQTLGIRVDKQGR